MQLLGVGVGLVLQNTIIAVQADCTDPTQIPQKTGLVTFGQLSPSLSPSSRLARVLTGLRAVGGTVGIAIASSIFGTRLSSALREFAPDAPFELVRQSVQVRK